MQMHITHYMYEVDETSIGKQRRSFLLFGMKGISVKSIPLKILNRIWFDFDRQI